MKGTVEYCERREGGEAWSDDGGGERRILTRTRNLANCLWPAAKRFTFWTLLLGSVPLLLPVLVFSLFAGLLFATGPVLCGIGAYVLFFHGILYPSPYKPLPRDDGVPALQSAEELQFCEKSDVVVDGKGDGSSSSSSQGRALRDSNEESKSLPDAVSMCLPLSDDDKEQKEVQEVVNISPPYQGSETGNDVLEVSSSGGVADDGHRDEGVQTGTAKSGTDGGGFEPERTADALRFRTALGAGAEGDSEELPLESDGRSTLEQGSWPLLLQTEQPQDFRRVEEEESEVVATTTFSWIPFPVTPQEGLAEEAAAAAGESLVSLPPSKLDKRPEEVLVGEEAAAAAPLVGTSPTELDETPEEVLKNEAAIAESPVGIASSKVVERPEEAQITTVGPSDERSSSKGKHIDEMPEVEEESENDSMTRKFPGTVVPHEVETPVHSLRVTIPPSGYVIPRCLDGALNGEERGNEEWIAKAPSSIAGSLEQNNDGGYAPISSLSMCEAPQQHHRFKQFGNKEWPERRSDIITSRSSEFPPGSTTCVESIDVFSGEFEGLLSYWREKDKGKSSPAYPPSSAEVACHLRREITVIQRILGEAFAPQYSIWKDVEKLSEIVGVQLPDMGDVSDLTKARIGLDLLRAVVGVKDIDDAPTSSI